MRRREINSQSIVQSVGRREADLSTTGGVLLGRTHVVHTSYVVSVRLASDDRLFTLEITPDFGSTTLMFAASLLTKRLLQSPGDGELTYRSQRNEVYEGHPKSFRPRHIRQ